VYIILAFLMAFFYGNIFWVFGRAIRYKTGLLRLAICAGWFLVVLGANYLIAGPVWDPSDQAQRPPVPANHVMQRRVTISDDAGFLAFPLHYRIRLWRESQFVMVFAFLFILGLSIAYFFLKAWARSELTQTRLQANQLSTEIKFLKSQVNPHFLFNTLNNLFSMAQDKGNDELADGISKLSGMMRYMLYDSNAERVALSKEIAYLQECITLNKLRYADEEAVVIFDQTGQVADISVAPMLFIPFVENAFKYGVAIGQRAEIFISIVVHDHGLAFCCINTDFSAVKKMDMEISGIGLENVRRRLELVYPGQHRLDTDKEDGKFIVKLEIDLS
jgi:sensor histidine kinase YesM